MLETSIMPTIWLGKLRQNPKADLTTRAARFRSSSGSFGCVRLTNGISGTERVKRLAGFPYTVAAYRIISKLEVDSFVTQVLTGHGGFSECLHRFKCMESPSFVCDPASSESVFLLLLDYPMHLYDRLECEKRLGLAVNKSNLNLILSCDRRNYFLEFCRKICVLANKRNRN
ncbi:unnamed protein product [Euphydryas editha]|uniref:Uncharacterized protein n=1 Tax=Euphydryas editha TaxID=104508 RepID=A0AAU9VBM2_EUPED|nr:unnamed protein product [Euphydryas editha]